MEKITLHLGSTKFVVDKEVLSKALGVFQTHGELRSATSYTIKSKVQRHVLRIFLSAAKSNILPQITRETHDQIAQLAEEFHYEALKLFLNRAKPKVPTLTMTSHQKTTHKNNDIHATSQNENPIPKSTTVKANDNNNDDKNASTVADSHQKQLGVVNSSPIKVQSNETALDRHCSQPTIPSGVTLPFTTVETSTTTKYLNGKKIILKRTIKKTIKKVPIDVLNSLLETNEETVVTNSNDRKNGDKRPLTTKKITRRSYKRVDNEEYLNNLIKESENQNKAAKDNDTQTNTHNNKTRKEIPHKNTTDNHSSSSTKHNHNPQKDHHITERGAIPIVARDIEIHKQEPTHKNKNEIKHTNEADEKIKDIKEKTEEEAKHSKIDKEEAKRLEEEKEEAERIRKEMEESERLKKEWEEAERKKREWEEAEEIRKKKEEAEKLEKEKEEAERLKKKKDEAERLRKEKEESERLKKEEEESERLRKEEEAERLRKEEEAERLRKEEEEAERLRKEEEEERLRKEEEEEKSRKQKEEIEKLKKQKEEVEKLKKQKEETERLRKLKEEAERIKKEKDEADRLRKEKEEADRLKNEKEKEKYEKILYDEKEEEVTEDFRARIDFKPSRNRSQSQTSKSSELIVSDILTVSLNPIKDMALHLEEKLFGTQNGKIPEKTEEDQSKSNDNQQDDSQDDIDDEVSFDVRIARLGYFLFGSKPPEGMDFLHLKSKNINKKKEEEKKPDPTAEKFYTMRKPRHANRRMPKRILQDD